MMERRRPLRVKTQLSNIPVFRHSSLINEKGTLSASECLEIRKVRLLPQNRFFCGLCHAELHHALRGDRDDLPFLRAKLHRHLTGRHLPQH